MPTFIVTGPEGAMIVVKNEPVFILDSKYANKYTSKYQAKRHLKQLDNVPDNVKIVPLLTEEGTISNG